ncbi:MAG TPA: DUF4838 domain-containing protein [Candidatus Jeotgalibaca pullicola]|nr:DUF4838 domain-containing protein [Candidatus Jeotgalibaca pullicola]
MKIWFNQEVENQDFLLKELSYYSEKVFNEKVTVDKTDVNLLLSVEKNASDLDQISITYNNGNGSIKSNSQVGLLIAVYRFFKELGVRYLRPGKKNEIIVPQSKNKAIHIAETASFKHRGVCIEGADSFENICDFIDWLPKIGMNSFFIQFENPYSFLKRWYEHEFNPYLEKEPFTNELAQEMSDRIDNEMQIRGLLHHRVGHGWTSETLGYSSKYGWESGLKLPDEKKSLVAELNGERELFDTAPILTSLDFANPEVADKMVDLIVDYAKERQDVDYLHVWLSDARNNICECEQCKKDIPADQYIRILNQLDDALTDAGLNTKICFLLYHELLFAPEKETLKNPNRFTMMFAPITRTFEMSYADVDYENDIPPAKAYVRNKIVLPNSLEENLSYLFEWQKKFNGDSFVYDYPLGRAHYGDLGYMKISKVIYRDVKYLKNLNLNGYISCQELRAGFPHNFPNYVMGHLLWDNEIDYEELKKEYFENMYGSDWKEVVTYLEQLSLYSSCDYFNAIGERVNDALNNRYQIAVNLANEFLSTLEKNSSTLDGIQKEEWKKLGYHREFVIKLGDALKLLSEGKNNQAQLAWRDFLDYIRRNELIIQENLDVYRIIEVAKNYAGFYL